MCENTAVMPDKDLSSHATMPDKDLSSHATMPDKDLSSHATMPGMLSEPVTLWGLLYLLLRYC
jgi:hypothetical protein